MPHVRLFRATAALLVSVVAIGLAAGCRGVRTESPGTHVSQGDVLSGRLPPQSPRGAFTFEGVESSLLDFTLQSDELNRSAPHPVLTGPDGATVGLADHRVTPEGAATTRYEGILLRRTGTYRLTLESVDRSDDAWYLYRHSLRFPSIVDDRAQLTASATHPITFTAPYGGTVNVRVTPANRSPLQPELRGVVDPLGGRALDRTATPGGVMPPQQAATIDGGVVLVFVAPRAGRYTVLAAAKPGHEGEASIHVDVVPPSFDRAVWHPGSEPLGAAAPSIGAPMVQSASKVQTMPKASPPPAPPPPAPSFTGPSTASAWSTPPTVVPAGR